MGKLKIIAKSHMLSKTATIFFTFLLCISALFFSGDLSLIASYTANLLKIGSPLLENILILSSAVLGIALIFLLCAPLRLGRERWFMMNASGEDPKFKEIFYYFKGKRLLRSLGAWSYALVVKLGFAAVFFFPFLCLSGVLYYCLSTQSTAFAIIVCLFAADAILLMIGSAFMFVCNGTFLLYYPIIVSGAKVGFAQAYSYSKAMTSPVLKKLARFRLSFAPWWTLCLLVLPSFYVWGYYKQSMSELAYRNEYL